MRRKLVIAGLAAVAASVGIGIPVLAAPNAPSSTPLLTAYGCVAGANRTLQHVYLVKAKYESSRAARGSCPSGVRVTIGYNSQPILVAAATASMAAAATRAPAATARSTPKSTPSAVPASAVPSSTVPANAGPSSTVPTNTGGTPAGAPTASPAQTPATTSAGWSCTVTTYPGHCPGSGAYNDPSFTSTFSVNSGYPMVNQNVWNPVSGETQEIQANSPADWQVTTDIPAASNPGHGVTSYPNAGIELAANTLTQFPDITSTFADTVPTASGNEGWQGYDLWFNNWGDEEMIQTQWVGASPCSYVAVQQFGGSKGVPVQTWGLCVYGSEKIWKLAPAGTQVGGSATVNETSGSVDITAMTDFLVAHGYMKSTTAAATTVTALSAGFEICNTAGPSVWAYSKLTFSAG